MEAGPLARQTLFHQDRIAWAQARKLFGLLNGHGCQLTRLLRIAKAGKPAIGINR